MQTPMTWFRRSPSHKDRLAFVARKCVFGFSVQLWLKPIYTAAGISLNIATLYETGLFTIHALSSERITKVWKRRLVYAFVVPMQQRQGFSKQGIHLCFSRKTCNAFYYSKICLKRPLKKKTKNWFSRPICQKYCRMLQESILQYFRPSLSYHLSLRHLFCLFF